MRMSIWLTKSMLWPSAAIRSWSLIRSNTVNMSGKRRKMCMQAVRDTRQAPDRIFDFLMQWWDRHILQEDQLYKPYLKQ